MRRRHGTRNSDIEFQIQITRHGPGNPLALEAQLSPKRGSRRQVHRQGPRRRSDLDIRAQCRLPRSHGNPHMHIPAADAQPGIAADMDLEIQIPGRAAAATRQALAGKPDQLALRHPSRYLDLQGSRLRHDLASGIQADALQRERALRATVGLLDVDADLGMLVFARPSLRRARTLTRARARRMAEQRLEKLAVIGGGKARVAAMRLPASGSLLTSGWYLRASRR